MKINLPIFSDLEKALVLSYLSNPRVQTGIAKFRKPTRFVISIKHRQANIPTALGIARTKHQATIAALESLRRRFNNASQ